MNYPAVPVDPAADIGRRLETIEKTQQELVTAVNDTGQLVQWIVDNVRDIFAMFGSPQMMGMMSQAMPAMTGALGNDGPGNGTAGDSAGGPAAAGLTAAGTGD